MKPKLIVVDPLQSYLGAAIDAHRANETRPILDGLALLAEKYELSALILRHAAKAANGARAIHKGLGSIDFTGAVRSEMFAGATGEGQRAMVHIKSNVGPLGQALGYEISESNGSARCPAGYFHWTGQTDISTSDLTAPEQQRDTATDEAIDFLKELLAQGPRLVDEVRHEARAAGIADRTLNLAKTKLGFKSRKRFGDGKWEWSLSSGQTQ